MPAQRPEGSYRVTLCATCGHPGGQHRLPRADTPEHCVLCVECKAYVEGDKAWWTDEMTERAKEAVMAKVAAVLSKRQVGR